MSKPILRNRESLPVQSSEEKKVHFPRSHTFQPKKTQFNTIKEGYLKKQNRYWAK